MSKIKRNQSDLIEDLNDQIKILQNACREFDLGEYYQAKTIATSLRKFCKHHGSNRAILQQLGLMDSLHFLDSSLPESGNLAQGRFLLTGIFLGDKFTKSIIPHLDSGESHYKYLNYTSWWTKKSIIFDMQNRVFSREKIVLFVAEQDGGAHVDPELSLDYFELSRNNSSGFMHGNIEGDWFSSSKDAIYSTIRQIAYELLVSLGKPGFQELEVAWKNDNGYVIGMNGITFS